MGSWVRDDFWWHVCYCVLCCLCHDMHSICMHGSLKDLHRLLVCILCKYFNLPYACTPATPSRHSTA